MAEKGSAANRLRRIETAIVGIPSEELGNALKAYIAESNHQGWDGFSSRDRTGIMKFLEHLILHRMTQ